MDPQQSALPLQLHSNSFAMGSGQVPKLRVEEGGEGGDGTAAQVHQPIVTPPTVSVPGGAQVNRSSGREGRGAKGRLDVKSGSCGGLLTICRSGIMFPWMNPRTADFKQSGNTIFFLNNNLWLKEGKKREKIKTCERTNIVDTISTPANLRTGCFD